VTAAIVTYGARRDLLLAVLERLQVEGVGRAVVIDNGAHWPVATTLAERFGDWTQVVTMGANTGSSRGFAAAFEAAVWTDKPLVWVLDDDNCPREGCLAVLLAAYAQHAAHTPVDLQAVVAARAEHSTGNVSDRQLLTRWDSFGGFHVADVVNKIVRRLPRRQASDVPRDRQVGVTHFGGMLFHRSLVDRFGLPRSDFFMYADDTEFTWRITAAGGRIIQVADAVVEDLEPAAQQTARLRNRFVAALLTDSDFRSYYAVRNLAFFESRFRRRNRVIFALNRLLFFAILHFYARKMGRIENYDFIRRSVAEGLAGRLGLDGRFPLH
jgi:GT2 family glycosyltransferase